MCCRSAHLTNDAVQKTLGSYHQFEDHCKLRMEELQARGGDESRLRRGKIG